MHISKDFEFIFDIYMSDLFEDVFVCPLLQICKCIYGLCMLCANLRTVFLGYSNDSQLRIRGSAS